MDPQVASYSAKPVEPISIVYIGVGGGGCNTVNGMIERGIQGVKFMAVDTDIRVLEANKAEVKLQIGSGITEGRSTGGVPETGEEAALESKELIAKALKGVDMVFITACMGYGTGTGAAPIIAEIAKNQGALTVGFATKPLKSLKSKRMEQAVYGIIKFKKVVDILTVIQSQELFNYMDPNTGIRLASHEVDDIICRRVESILNCINKTGYINIDFADTIAVIKDQGESRMAIGYGVGKNRVKEAVSSLLVNPLLEGVSIKYAAKVFIYVAGSEEIPILEYDDVAKQIIAEMDIGALIKTGLYIDTSLNDAIRVMVIAADFKNEI